MIRQPRTQSNVYSFFVLALRFALVLALGWAGWSIYSHLPGGPLITNRRGAGEADKTSLHITLQGTERDTGAPLDVPVELYPIDMAAAQREYFFEKRPGMRLETFLLERMNGRAPIKDHFNDRGEVTLVVPPGSWWVHATLPGDLNIEWRLRVNVYGSKQSVELTPENAYTRTQSF